LIAASLWIVSAREFVLETAIIVFGILRALQQQLKFMVGQSTYNAAVDVLTVALSIIGLPCQPT
jgi:hypothetical protein